MEKAAVLADSRLFLPVSPRDACVQEQAVQLLPTTQQQPTKNKQLPDSYYNYELLLQLPTTTTHTYYQYCNPLVLLSSPSELLQPLRTSQHQRKRSALLEAKD